MITLNGEKELLRITSWDDVLTRPDFDDRLNPDDHELASIIGSYVFAEKIACGLSNCRTPHSRGYLVATKSGRVTNIGKDCGANYFGVDFEDMSRQFDRDIANKENRERLWSFSFQLDGLQAQIAKLRKDSPDGRGADWAHKRSRALVQLNQGCPAAVVQRVIAMLRTGDSEVRTQREATADEARLMALASGRELRGPQYVEGSAGRVAHLDALSKENDLRELLIVDLEENLRAFAPLDIDQLTPAELKRWVKWAAGAPFTLERAEASLGICRKMLTATNLSPLEAVISDVSDMDNFRAFLASLG
jgi:hypothetical protein